MEKINENFNKIFFGYHDALKKFMGHQSYVLLCTETTVSNP